MDDQLHKSNTYFTLLLGNHIEWQYFLHINISENLNEKVSVQKDFRCIFVTESEKYESSISPAMRSRCLEVIVKLNDEDIKSSFEFISFVENNYSSDIDKIDFKGDAKDIEFNYYKNKFSEKAFSGPQTF